jgi:hypothetical protein
VTANRLRPLVFTLGLAAALTVIFVLPGRVAEAPKVEGEVTLLVFADPGVDPFTASVLRSAPPPAPPAPGAPAPAPSAISSPSATATEAATSSGAAVVESASGGEPGLYGGSRRFSACDVARLSALLSGDTPRAGAWAQVAGIATADVDAYVKALTAVVLRRDTRVTAHGYAGGRSTDVQAVLQTGTAVLVDSFGVPRVRCISGAPLTDPVAQAVEPVYLGIRWAAFQTSPLAAVRPAPTALTAFVLVDAASGGSFSRPVAGDGSSDAGT